jgi:hypothetical protein
MHARTCFALSLIVVASNSAAALAVGPFSPTAIFALPDHNDVDDRCHNARAFMEHASRTVDDIDAAAAVQAAASITSCFNLPRLSPDEDQQRYLYLAAATALYVAATKSTGADAAALLQRVDEMARDLGATGPDRTVVITHVENGGPRTNSDQIYSSGNGTMRKDYYTVGRSPLGTAVAGKFTGDANSLLAAAGDEANHLNARPQAADVAGSPAPETK